MAGTFSLSELTIDPPSWEWEECGYLPCDSPQTNNRAELLAIIERMQGQIRKVAVATDLQYYYDGPTGSAFRWRRAGWVNKQGPVANVDLWIRLLSLVDGSTLSLRWVKVPTHTAIPWAMSRQTFGWIGGA